MDTKLGHNRNRIGAGRTAAIAAALAITPTIGSQGEGSLTSRPVSVDAPLYSEARDTARVLARADRIALRTASLPAIDGD